MRSCVFLSGLCRLMTFRRSDSDLGRVRFQSRSAGLGDLDLVEYEGDCAELTPLVERALDG